MGGWGANSALQPALTTFQHIGEGGAAVIVYTGEATLLLGLHRALRVCSRKRIAGEPPCHELDHRGLDEGEACCR
ncbi:hypothetical protein EDC90_102670, partial [Martelella mediterranea]